MKNICTCFFFCTFYRESSIYTSVNLLINFILNPIIICFHHFCPRSPCHIYVRATLFEFNFYSFQVFAVKLNVCMGLYSFVKLHLCLSENVWVLRDSGFSKVWNLTAWNILIINEISLLIRKNKKIKYFCSVSVFYPPPLQPCWFFKIHKKKIDFGNFFIKNGIRALVTEFWWSYLALFKIGHLIYRI